MGATASLEILETPKVRCCPGETLKTATWSSIGQLSSKYCCSVEKNCEVRRKLKDLCTATDDEHCVTYSTAGASTCDEGLVDCSCNPSSKEDVSTHASGTHTFSTRQERSLADTLDSKCLEVETFSTVRRNLMEHGLPLMLRTAELGNSLHEYFVCIHKGGEHFSLLDRKVSRDKNNFHYAWEDLRKYHFVEYMQQQDGAEVAAERQELKPSGYYTSELVRCTFSESCRPQQIDLMFRSKEALQCVIDIFQSKMNAKLHPTNQATMSPNNTASTLSCPGFQTNWIPFPDSPKPEAWTPLWGPSPDATPQAVRASSPLPVVPWPSPSPRSEMMVPLPESDSERPPDWAAMSERSLNSFYAV